MKKSLEQYKKEFEELEEQEKFWKGFPQDEEFIEEFTPTNNGENLAYQCITDYPDEDLGYIELGSIIGNSLNSYDENTIIEYIFKLTESNPKYILTLETMFESGNLLMKEEYNIPKDDKNFINVWLFAVKNAIQKDSLINATQYMDVACNLGVPSKIFLEMLNPPLQVVTINDFICIENLTIKNIEKSKEIYFLGENGVGKTALLQAIVSGLVKDRKVYVNVIPFNKSVDGYLNLFAYGTGRFRDTENATSIAETGYTTLFDRNKLLINPIQWFEKFRLRELENETSLRID